MGIFAKLVVFAIVGSPSAGSITNGVLSAMSSSGSLDSAVLELPSVTQNVLSNPLLKMMPKGDARTNMMTSLMKTATASAQAPFMNVLNSFGVQSTPFWVSNKIEMRNVNQGVLNALSAVPGPFTVREPFKVKLIEPKQGDNSTFSAKATTQWGVQKIGAPSVWSKSDGSGVLVAGIDTGVDASHPALSGNYAGQWHDAMSGQDEPYDDSGHGTHTMGTICGTENGIGVAPGARWVACRGLSDQGGTDTTLSECAQWVLSLDEKPVVVSNSWGGGQGSTFFNDEIQAWQEAGIIPVFAIGNEGSSCGSASSPGDQPNLISVGATDSRDRMARFSSRGPARRSNNRMKPEVSAPGVNVVSAWPGGGYKSLQGTSMATPHVAGAIALMKGANPDLTYSQILKKLTDTTDKPNVSSADLKCGNVNSRNPYPNNAYGAGRINVAKAMK